MQPFTTDRALRSAKERVGVGRKCGAAVEEVDPRLCCRPTITPPLVLCGAGQDCRASGTCRTQSPISCCPRSLTIKSKSLFHRLLLVSVSGSFLGLLHQRVIDLDIGAHGLLHGDVYRLIPLYTLTPCNRRHGICWTATGWVKRSNPPRLQRMTVMGIATLHPSYAPKGGQPMSLAAPLDPMATEALSLMPAATQSRTVTFRRTSHLRCCTGGAHWSGAMFWRATGTCQQG